MGAIPFGGIVVFAEEEYTVIKASEIANNTNLELTEHTEIVMDKELYLKSIKGDYNIRITGEETLNVTTSEDVINVRDFICSAPLIVSQTSASTYKPAIEVDYFNASGNELVVYGNQGIHAKKVYITSKVINIRANKYIGINSSGTLTVNCSTMVVNAGTNGLSSHETLKLSATRNCIINSGSTAINTTGELSSTHAYIILGGNIVLNSETTAIKAANGALYSGSIYNAYKDITPLEKLYINANQAVDIRGIITMKCDDAQFVSTGKNLPCVESSGDMRLEGIYDIKSNGGYGLLSEYGMNLQKGYFKISGAKEGYAAIMNDIDELSPGLKIAEGLQVFVPENGSFDKFTVLDSNGNPAKEVEIYSLIDDVDISMMKPISGMPAYMDERAIISTNNPFVSFSHITWYEDGIKMSEGDLFKEGPSYSAEVVLYGEDYKCFPSGQMLKVNGKKVDTGLSSLNRMIYLRPNFGACRKAISDVNLNVATPKEGNRPSTSITRDTYNVSISNVVWHDGGTSGIAFTQMSSTQKFIGGHYYTLTFNLNIANSNYAFQFMNNGINNSFVKVKLNGKPVNLKVNSSNCDTTIKCTFEMGKCNDSKIEEIDIRVEAPKAGEHPSYDANVLGTGYYIDTTKNSYEDIYWKNPPEKWYYVKNGVSWWDVTDGNYDYVYEHDVFLPDHEYKCEVYVRTEDGYEFNMDLYANPEIWPTAYMNGKTAEILDFGSNLQLQQEVSLSFKCIRQVVNQIDVLELSKPLGGGTPDTVATTSAPNLYNVENIVWYDALGNKLPANEKFEAGRVYRVRISIASAKHSNLIVSSFASNAKTTINGDELDMINISNANSDDIEDLYNHTYYKNTNSVEIYYTFKPAPQPKLGDINFDNSVDIRDLIRLKKIIAGLESNISNADVNYDGKVNSLDIGFIKQYIIQSHR